LIGLDSRLHTALLRKNRQVEMQSASETRRFQLVLIKPSHYDDEGYVIVLGAGVAIDIKVIDETNTRSSCGMFLRHRPLRQAPGDLW
jgi:hypothetical protein